MSKYFSFQKYEELIAFGVVFLWSEQEKFLQIDFWKYEIRIGDLWI